MLNERNLGTPAFFIGWGRIAALMFVFVVGDLFISWAQGTPIVRVFALGVAALVWLIGRALRPLRVSDPRGNRRPGLRTAPRSTNSAAYC